MRPSNSESKRNGRGLVVFPGALGDFLCFLPTLKVILDWKRGVDLEIAMCSEFADLLYPRVPAISVRPLDCHRIGRLFARVGEVDQGVRDSLCSYDFIYSWFGAHHPDFVENLSVLYEGDLRIFPFRSLDPKIHMTNYYLSCLEVTDTLRDLPEIPLRSAEIAWSGRYWSEAGLHGQRVLALAPGSGAKEKNWVLPYFKKVSHWWRERAGGGVLVILGPAEEEWMVGEKPWEDALFVRHRSLGQVAALLTRCNVYLGNDSGLSHLAAALGVHTLAIFGPTEPVQWSPGGRNVRVITQGAECSPCHGSTMRTCAHRRCLSELSPEYVIGFLEEILAGSLLDKGGMQI